MHDELLEILRRRINNKPGEPKAAGTPEAKLGSRARGMLGILRAMPPGKHNMCEIVEWLARQGREDDVAAIILGSKATTAPTCIADGTDVCYRCTNSFTCAKRLAALPNGLGRTDLLMAYRFDICDFLRSALSLPEYVRLLVADPLLLKFAVAYATAVDAKNQLKVVGLVNVGLPTLEKNHGKYCPYTDIWSLQP